MGIWRTTARVAPTRGDEGLICMDHVFSFVEIPGALWYDGRNEARCISNGIP